VFRAFTETLHECITFYKTTCDFYIKCIGKDLTPTLYDFGVSNFDWITGRFADTFKESKYKRLLKNGKLIYYSHHGFSLLFLLSWCL